MTREQIRRMDDGAIRALHHRARLAQTRIWLMGAAGLRHALQLRRTENLKIWCASELEARARQAEGR